MHLRRALPVCLLLSLLASAPADAQFRPPAPRPPGEDFHVELGIALWKPTPEIVIGSGTAGQLPSVDFVHEFGIEKKRFNEFRAVLKGGKNKLRVSHVDATFNDTTQLQRTLAIGGRTFGVNTNATSDFQWEMWRIGYEHDFVAGSHGLFGLLTEVNFNHVVASVQAPELSSTMVTLTDEKVPVPAIGLIGRVYPHRTVSITVEYSGFKMPGFLAGWLLDDEDADAHFRAFDTYVTGSITRYLGIQAGYRFLSIDYELERASGDIQLKGPYFGGMIRF